MRVINADGTGEVDLGAGAEPAWAPDGARLAYSGSSGIELIGLDGTRAVTLVPRDFRPDVWKPDDLGVGKPAWSPDGALVAFEHRGDGDLAPAKVFVVDSRGGQPRAVTMEVGFSYAESDPSWTPDGSEIVFWSFGYGIAIVSAAGGSPGGVYKNFPTVSYGTKPVIAPDGRICFTAGRYYIAGPSIWCTNRQNGLTQVFLDGGFDAVWSPNGATIAFGARPRPGGE